MEEQKEKVQELAETLKSRGLAASMIDAMDKAKNIIYGISAKKEEPKVEEKEVEQVSHNKEESIEITKTNVDESNVMEKDISADIKEVGQETSTVESKTDKDQQKLDEVKIIEDNDYDISKEEKTVNEKMGEHNPKTEEDVFTSSHESDNLLKENPETHQTEEESRIIKTIDETPYEEEPISIDDIPEQATEEETEKETEQPSQQESSEEKPKQTEEEKKKTDLSEIFDFNKR